jgi:hypothetical protein
MFYPKISRRNTYSSPHNRGGHFADYRAYAAEIADDCKHRCVYCDARVAENLGGDSFELDHFRPKKHFSHLECDPTNLVLACSACNRFKSAHWPAGTTTTNTHVNGLGFIEPFSEDRLLYFSICRDGKISAIQPPSEYLVELLHLNRAAQINLRRRRLLVNMCKDLTAEIESRIGNLIDFLESGTLTKEKTIGRLRKLQLLQVQLTESLSILGI